LQPYCQERKVPVQGMCNGLAATWDWRVAPGDPNPSERALLVDANAALLTSPDFGCDLYEPNDESKRFWTGAHLAPEHDPAICTECRKRGKHEDVPRSA
jgi:hypothetical protein